MSRDDDGSGNGGCGGDDEGERVGWDALEADLRAAGYAVDRQDGGVVMVTVPADVPGLAREPEGLLGRLLARLPGVLVPTDPAVVPADRRATVAGYGATAEVHSGSRAELHVVVSADGVR